MSNKQQHVYALYSAIAAAPQSDYAPILQEMLDALLGKTNIPVAVDAVFAENIPGLVEPVPAPPQPEKTQGFAMVGGMDEVKRDIRLRIIEPLRNPQLYASYGLKAGGGILLYGPPGCGKTHIARATAGEIQANFISFGLHEVLNMYLGESERHLHEIFESARATKPTVLFIDEVDALGYNRKDRGGAGHTVINQFLLELDSLESDNEGVLVIAATNTPWSVDSALRRPGRFDRILFIPPPDLEARISILGILCTGKLCDKLDLVKIAQKTKGFSGADLKVLVDIALKEKLEISLTQGGLHPLGTKDLLHHAAQLRPSTGEWFATARNHALYANQNGSYSDVIKYLDSTR